MFRLVRSHQTVFTFAFPLARKEKFLFRILVIVTILNFGHSKWKQCQTLFWGAPKSLRMVTAAMKLKDAYSLEGKL